MIFQVISNKVFRINFLLGFILLSNVVYSQVSAKEHMEKLNFMVGEWIGTTTVFEDGKVTKQGSAFQRISYDLSKHIIVVELNSEFLQLHTIINYDEKDQTYYYHPFSKRGSGKYPAELKDGQLIVSPNETTHYIFGKTGENSFREYGEKLKDGKWVKTFEDNFIDSK